jgi:hypothetical protein
LNISQGLTSSLINKEPMVCLDIHLLNMKCMTRMVLHHLRRCLR